MYLATPAEVIGHYYCFLSNNLDNSVVCQIMLSLELLTEEDLVHSAIMYSDCQKNAFLLDKLLVTGTTRIVEFCNLLQSKENQQELEHMLVKGKSNIYCTILVTISSLFYSHKLHTF